MGNTLNNVSDQINTLSDASQPTVSMDTVAAVASPVKEGVAKKAVAKKAIAKKVVAKKAIAKKVVAKKAIAKKVVVKKLAAKKVVEKKVLAKKVVAKNIVAKKTRVTNARKAEPVVAKTELKAKKVKLIRDSFTMPDNEYQVLQDIKKGALKAGIELKKSDLLRIGVGMLKAHSYDQLGKIRATLTKLSAGRPKK